MLKRKINDRLMIAANQKLKERDYWLQKLSGEWVKSYFHYDRFIVKSDASENGYAAADARVDFCLEGELFSRLMQLSKGADSRLHMILVAALVILLHKYTGHSDIILGSPIYKQDVDIEFINTVLPLRSQIAPGMTFKELLLQVLQVITEAIENQNYPMEVLIEQLDLTYDETGIDFPLFDVMLIMENIQDKRYTRNIQTNTVFSFFRTDDNVIGSIQYNSQRYEQARFQRLIIHLKTLLQQILFSVDSTISTVTILSLEEKKRILFEFNNTQKDIRRDICYHQLFEEQVHRCGDRIAAIFNGNNQITYKKLNGEANRIARFLSRNGIAADAFVAIYMKRCIKMLASIFGTFKAGGAYLGLDIDYPGERIKNILEDCEAKVLITQTENIETVNRVKDRLPGLLTVLYLDGDTQLSHTLNGYSTENSRLPISSDNLAYIIYTSGTTGLPKGVMIHHLGMLNHIYANIAFLGITEEDIIAQTASLSFDISVWQFLTAGILGGAVYIVDRQEVGEPSRLIYSLQKGRVTILEAVPALMAAFLEVIKQEGHKELKYLRWMIPTGEALPVALARQWYRHCPGIKLVNAYGPAEASDDVTLWVIEAADLEDQGTIPIGKPLQNLHIYIMDTNLSLCPTKVPGEICIAGIGVGKGYLKNPTKTAKSFVPNPYAPEIGGHDYEIIYKTGDIGYFREDGNLEFLGRKDYQVKVRGFRIELEEIEHQLLSLDAVKEAVAVAKEDENGEKYLCAYVVFHPSAQLALPNLREHLALNLPYYMIPSYFMILEKIPLTPNGKIDRKALPDPEIKKGDGYIAPRNEIEEKLADIWAEVLDIDKSVIGINSNFFELGGHSLKAILLISKIHKALNIKLPLAEIFDAQTIRELAQIIQKETPVNYISIEPVEKKEYYVLSSSQKRLYVLQQLDLEGTSYNMPILFNLGEGMNEKKMEEICSKLISRHESLRTSFELIHEKPVQKIHPNINIGIEYHEAGGNAKKTVTEIFRDFIRPFDLTLAPLLRLGLIKSEGLQNIAMLDMHHIITDGVSQEVLIREISALYNGEDLSPLKLHYKDYSEWQQSRAVIEALKKKEEYWLKEFQGEIPVLDIPTDFPRPVVQSFEGAMVYFNLDETETIALGKIAAKADTTIFMVLLSLFNITLSNICNQQDIIVGVDVAGRNHADLENIIGMFVNTLALRNFPAAEKVYTGFLQELKERTLQAFENHDYQFEELVEKVAVARDTSRNPIFDVMFSFTDKDTGTGAIGGTTESPLSERLNSTKSMYSYEKKTTKFDLTLTGMKTPKFLFFSFEYCTKLFRKETIKRFVNCFKQVVNSVIRDRDRRIAEIEIITEEEKEKILYIFNNTKKEVVRDKGFPALFEEQVDRAPHKIAAIHNQRHITYSRLNEEANHIAHLLLSKGIRDTFVALYLKRSIAMLASIIGVFKTNGAYIPIEVDYPPDRVIYILENSGSKVVITSEDNHENLNRLQEASSSIQVNQVFYLDYEKSFSTNEHGKLLENPGLIGVADQFVYMIYTSGTTGKPKGVLIHQLGMINHLYAKINDLSVTSGDTIAQTASSCFDISVWQFLTGLLLGATTFIVDKETVLEPWNFFQVLRKGRVSILESVPSLMTAFLETVVQENAGELKHLRWMIPTGEPLTPSLVREWYRHFHCIPLLNAYGPTEASDDVTHYRVPVLFSETQSTIPIGNPLQNLHIYILDRHLALCPVGIRGEICVAGVGIGKGYWQNVEKTQASFIPNPFLDKIKDPDFAVLYQTGDIGYFREDGSIECLGRFDYQVKIRGNRIELEEIERRLIINKNIKDAVVVCKVNGHGDKYLCAYIVLEKNNRGMPEHRELREYLSQTLPDYMIPAYFVPLDAIPVTPNGKIDRKALPEPQIETVEGAYIGPRNKVEESFVEIWTEVLGIEKDMIGIDSNFFQLGGNSLNAMILVSKIYKTLDVKLTLVDLFKTPYIRELAEQVQFMRASKEHKFASIEPVEAKEYYPLSSAQKRFYVLQQLDLENTGFNLPNMAVLKMKPDKKKFEDIFNKLIERHESFRTSFLLVEGEPCQRIHREVEFAIEYHSERPQRHSPETIFGHFLRPFDLSQAPLLRVGLIEMDVDEYILMVDMHHIVADGLSQGVLLKEFWHLVRDVDKELPVLPIQYKDFSEWQNSKKGSDAIKKQEEYWIEVLNRGIPELNLPIDFERPEIQSFAGSLINFALGVEETSQLKKIAQEEGATLFMVILAICNIWLSRICAQETIIIGTGASGRTHPDLEQIIGTFQNMLVLVNEPAGDKTFREFLSEVKKKALEAFDNQDFQFEELVRKVITKRDARRNPLFDFFYIFNDMELQLEGEPDGKTPDLEMSFYPHEVKITRFDLALTGTNIGKNITLSMEYGTSLFKKETIEKIITYFKQIMTNVIGNRDIKLKDIKISHSLFASKDGFALEDYIAFEF